MVHFINVKSLNNPKFEIGKKFIDQVSSLIHLGYLLDVSSILRTFFVKNFKKKEKKSKKLFTSFIRL